MLYGETLIEHLNIAIGFNEYVTDSLKCFVVKQRSLFPISTQILESVFCFLTK